MERVSRTTTHRKNGRPLPVRSRASIRRRRPAITERPDTCTATVARTRHTAATNADTRDYAAASAGFENGLYLTVNWSILPLNLNGALSQ